MKMKQGVGDSGFESHVVDEVCSHLVVASAHEGIATCKWIFTCEGRFS